MGLESNCQPISDNSSQNEYSNILEDIKYKNKINYQNIDSYGVSKPISIDLNTLNFDGKKLVFAYIDVFYKLHYIKFEVENDLSKNVVGSK